MRDFRNPRYKVLRDREECIDCDLWRIMRQRGALPRRKLAPCAIP